MTRCPHVWAASPVFGVAVATLLVMSHLFAIDATAAERRAAPGSGFQRGVNFDHTGGFGRELDSAAAAASLDRLVALGVSHVSITPSFFQRRLGDSSFYWKRSREREDADVRQVVRLARARGLQVLLKPHLWLEDRSDGAWRGQIDPSPAAWPAWQAAYRDALLGYSRLAAEEGAFGMVLGSELTALAVGRPEFWRGLAKDVRALFPGELTYASNWYAELDRITWWDAVDYVAVDAFQPLVAGADEPLDEATAVARLAEARAQLQAVGERFGRPTLVTEIGLKSAVGAGYRPWEWHDGNPVDLGIQARFFRALARVFPVAPDVAPADAKAASGRVVGVYIWKWYADLDWGGAENSDFTPSGKPAEAILGAWYGSRESPVPMPVSESDDTERHGG